MIIISLLSKYEQQCLLNATFVHKNHFLPFRKIPNFGFSVSIVTTAMAWYYYILTRSTKGQIHTHTDETHSNYIATISF